MLRVNGQDLNIIRKGRQVPEDLQRCLKALEYLELPTLSIQEAKRQGELRCQRATEQHFTNGCWNYLLPKRYQH